MNDRMLEVISQRPDFGIDGADKKVLDFFCDYLDHGSLFLVEFMPGDDPAFLFTNDAQRYTFRMSDIRGYVTDMKSGRQSMDWETVPFELISRETTG